MDVTSPDTNFIGTTTWRNPHRYLFGIKNQDRLKHLYLIGKSGVGKSSLFRGMIAQDIAAGRGVSVIDPHGDLAAELLDLIPRHRTEDVVYFNPADDRPVGLNILETVDPERRHLTASEVVSAFKGVFSNSWGPRLEYLLFNSVAALVEHEDTTLLDVIPLLTRADFRRSIVWPLQDPIVRSFWLDQYDRFKENYRLEIGMSLHNKLGAFLNAPSVRGVLAQKKSKFDVRRVLDEQQIFIANLSKGELGEDKSALLGSLLLSRFYLVGLSRIDTPEAERVPHYLFCDEFGSYASDSFASVLSESRKFGLGLHLAHQYLDQLSDEVKSAVFGNCGSMLSMKCGPVDAEVLAKQFEPYGSDDLATSEAFEVYLRLSIDGMTSPTFYGTTLPPSTIRNHGRRETVVRRSRERFGRPRRVIERYVRERITT